MLARITRITIGILILGFMVTNPALGAGKQGGHTTNPGTVVPPIKFGPNSGTQQDFDRKMLEFHRRTVPQAYREVGNHDPAWDEQVKSFLEGYAMSAANQPDAPSMESLRSLGRDIVAKGCTDPLFLSCYGMILGLLDEKEEAVKLLEQSVPELEKSKYPKVRAHQAAWRLYVLRTDIEHMKGDADLPYQDRIVRLTLEALKDGSFRAGESRMALRMLYLGWDKWYLRDQASEVEQKIRTLDGVDPYFREVFSGNLEISRAWRARGSGWGYDVTEEGWKGFEEHLDKARKYLVAAWKLYPEYPEAPCQMITVVSGQGDGHGETARQWFDRTVAAQLDHISAYNAILWFTRPRWGGSNEEMYAFGVACLNTGRFDTEVPWQFFVALQELEDDLDGDRAFWKRPATIKYLNSMFDGYEKAYAGKDLYCRYRTSRAAAYWYTGNYAAARRVLEDLGERAKPSVFSDLFKVRPEEKITEIYALGGPQAKEFMRAEALSRAGNYSDALVAYKSIEKELTPESKAAPYLKSTVSQLEIMKAFRGGDWVDLKINKDLLGWISLGGIWDVEPDGSITGTSTKEGMLLAHQADFGSRLEISGEVEFVQNVYEFFTAGVFLLGFKGSVQLMDDYIAGLLVKSEDKVTLQQSYGQKPQHTPGVRILPKNKFLVKMWDGDVQVFVNDALAAKGHVEREGLTPDVIHRVGIGGYYYFDGSTLRFSNLKVRRLTARPE